ncbi:MAG TPA: endonuclease/exonuclease/phosphatase family protein [Acidimicrobiia bacterium]|jgi:endonuclease/exonuclease/phosphatase family metal-dependent hydrolase|nr:endonuclease/exonuclease/phosphatase family protein [Acidimicrobiia bacterium]
MPALRVATFNVKHGDNGGGRVDLRRLGTACAGLSADVLAVQEVDRFARRTGFRDEMRVIARATGLEAVFGEAARRRWRTYGNVLLARGPISDVEVLKLPRPGNGEQRVAIVARVDVDGVGVSVGATHLSFRAGEGLPQLEVVLEALGQRAGPRVLLGDLNLGPELVEPAVMAAGYRLAPTGPTFPASGPRTRIDFVAVSGLEVVAASTPQPGISDHLPVVVELRGAAGAG